MRFTFSFFAALSLFVLPLASMAQDSSAKMLMTLANQERAKLGIAPLQWDDHLAAAALDHAKLMGDQKAISHQFANEPELTKRGADHNVHFSKIAENVAMVPDVNSAHEAWMNSPHHRDNILDPEVDTVGISFVEQDGEFYVVEDFCKTVASLSLEQQEQKVADLLGSSSLKLLNTEDVVDIARQTCALDTGWAGTRKPWFVMRWVSGDALSRLPDVLVERIATGKYAEAAVGACQISNGSDFTSFNIAVMLFPKSK